MSGEPEQELTKSLTQISPDDASIDTFTDFPTEAAIDLQIYDRQFGNSLGLEYFKTEADLIAETMRSYKRQSRVESTLGLLNNFGLMQNMVGVSPVFQDREKEKPERKGIFP